MMSGSMLCLSAQAHAETIPSSTPGGGDKPQEIISLLHMILITTSAPAPVCRTQQKVQWQSVHAQNLAGVKGSIMGA